MHHRRSGQRLRHLGGAPDERLPTSLRAMAGSQPCVARAVACAWQLRLCDINLGAVVRTIEPVSTWWTASPVASLQPGGRCWVTGIMSGALQSLMQYLDGYTLADLFQPMAPGSAGCAPSPAAPMGRLQKIAVLAQ